MLRKQLVTQSAAQLRAEAEKELRAELTWPEDLRVMAEQAHCGDVLENEYRNFQARGEALRGQISLLESQLAQVDAQILGYEDQIRAETRIIGTLQEELRAKRQLSRNAISRNRRFWNWNARLRGMKAAGAACGSPWRRPGSGARNCGCGLKTPGTALWNRPRRK